VTRLTLEALSTVTTRCRPLTTAVVQPVSVVSSDLMALESVGFAEAVIVSAIVAGKFAYVSPQRSRTILPDVNAGSVE
jgi:hypothetical protein